MALKKKTTEYYHVFNCSHMVLKDEYIQCIAYEMFCGNIDDFIEAPSRSRVKDIMREYIYRYGTSGWRGSTDTEQSIGPDEMERYNDCFDKATEIIDTLYPNMFTRDYINKSKIS